MLIPQLDGDLHKCCSAMEPRPARDNQEKILSAHLLAGRRSAACHFQHRLFRPETARATCPSGTAWIQHKPAGTLVASVGTGETGPIPADRNTTTPQLGAHRLPCPPPPSLYNVGFVRVSCVNAPHAAPFLWQQRG